MTIRVASAQHGAFCLEGYGGKKHDSDAMEGPKDKLDELELVQIQLVESRGEIAILQDNIKELNFTLNEKQKDLDEAQMAMVFLDNEKTLCMISS